MKISNLISQADKFQIHFLQECLSHPNENPSNESLLAGIFFDHRKVRDGSMFVAVRGTHIDGHQFLKQAVLSGAKALLLEAVDEKEAYALLGSAGLAESGQLTPSLKQLKVAFSHSTRKSLSLLAADFFQNPSTKLFTVGVTGTNGKTTSTHMVEEVLNGLGYQTGVVGTIDHHLGDHIWQTSMTTPDPVSFQSRLKDFRDMGATAVALEASSHALDQFRLDGVDFDFVAMTNLTRDHLDYHQTMDRYFAAKYRLFDELLRASTKKQKCAVFNTDDSWCKKAYEMLKSRGLGLEHISVFGFGRGPTDYQYQIIDQGFGGLKFELITKAASYEISLQMPGEHNVQNAIIAFAAGMAAGKVDRGTAERLIEILAKIKGVPGRLERVDNSQGIHVFVDYAHTDDALRSILSTLNSIRAKQRVEFQSAKIITIFGCGGDRDHGKRPLMMRAALAGSDFVVLTSDNPRSEDPEKIMDEAYASVRADEHVKVMREPDRRKAIEFACHMAKPDDVVLIAGKGHEKTQEVFGTKHPFSDTVVAKEVLDGQI